METTQFGLDQLVLAYIQVSNEAVILENERLRAFKRLELFGQSVTSGVGFVVLRSRTQTTFEHGFLVILEQRRFLVEHRLLLATKRGQNWAVEAFERL